MSTARRRWTADQVLAAMTQLGPATVNDIAKATLEPGRPQVYADGRNYARVREILLRMEANDIVTRTPRSGPGGADMWERTRQPVNMAAFEQDVAQ